MGLAPEPPAGLCAWLQINAPDQVALDTPGCSVAGGRAGTEAAGNCVFLGSIRYWSGGGQQARAAS